MGDDLARDWAAAPSDTYRGGRNRLGCNDDDARLREEKGPDLGDDARAAARREFDCWGLTAAERDVGLLLLQGLRHKEIAHARRTSERTVRQQALSVYRKAGVEGRSELAGHFLDRLMRPGAPRGESA
jgi:DNA-binding CsgD family transcriptional regulator